MINEVRISDYPYFKNDIPIHLRINEEGLCQWKSNCSEGDAWWYVRYWYEEPNLIEPRRKLRHRTSTVDHHIFEIVAANFIQNIQFVRMPKIYFEKPSRHREIAQMIAEQGE